MKLAVDTHVIRAELGDEAGLRLLTETGFDEVDLSFHGSPRRDPLLGENWEEETERFRAHMARFGLSCSQCHAPDDQDGLQPFDESVPAYRRTVRAIRSAALLGADHITLHSLYIPSLSPEQEWERNLEFFVSFTDVCRETGVRIALENLPIQVTDTPEQINLFLEQLSSPYYGALVDTGHAMISGITPEEYIRRLKPGSLIGIHVQDMHEKKDEHLVPWMGEINWENVIGALAACGYQGPMALEIVHFMEHQPRELLYSAHSYAAAAGRELIRMLEGKNGTKEK